MAAVSIPISPPEDDATESTLVHRVADSGCANCGAPLAGDQRYCVECGARRGKPRFSAESLATSTAHAAPSTPGVPPRGAPRRGTATTLIAGVATLLLAMGVGVLIGHNGRSSVSTRASAPQVITVGGGASATPTASNSSAARHTSKTASTKKAKTTVVHVTPKVSKKAAAAATKVLGASAPKNPTVQPGDSCTAGTPGCKNGKFTGDFFGGN